MSSLTIGTRASAPQRRLLPVLLALALLFAWTAVASGEDGLSIVRVEEDWEMVVAVPDPDSDAPQITCMISPTTSMESIHATFDLNVQSELEVTEGGLQLQLWEGEIPLAIRRFPSNTVLATPGETIRWTTCMELDNGTLTFEVVNGSSTTWGAFGGQGYLKGSQTTTLAGLDAYSPDVSVANTGIGYAANRVQSLVLKRIRIFFSSGEQSEIEVSHTVHSLD